MPYKTMEKAVFYYWWQETKNSLLSFSLPLTTSWSTSQQSYLGQGFKRNFRKRERWCGSAESLEGKSTEGWFARAITKTLNGLHSTGTEVFDFILLLVLLYCSPSQLWYCSHWKLIFTHQFIRYKHGRDILLVLIRVMLTGPNVWDDPIPADSSSKIVLTKQMN